VICDAVPSKRLAESQRLEGKVPEPIKFEVRVLGRLGAAGREAFADVDVRVDPAKTRLTGAFDQADLHTLLERLRAFGLEILEVRQIGR